MSGSNQPGSSAAPPVVKHHTQLGLTLFAIYVALYLGFMILAAYFPEQMAKPTPLGGVNLAVVYGVGLIVAALLLATIYTLFSRAADEAQK